MIYLLGSIFFASVIFLFFKLFGRYNIRNFPAIVVNYFTAACFGFLLLGENFKMNRLLEMDWLPFAVGIGFGFIFIFNLMAVTTQKLGASATSVTVKMSVAIPVVSAFFIYGDQASFLKILGILLALLGIYFSTKKDNSKEQKTKWLIFLPIVLFLGSGALDTLLKYVENNFVGNEEDVIMLLTPTIFFSAAIFGFLIFMGKGLFNKSKFKIGKKDILWGIALGIINYGSIFCLFSALNYRNWESSTIFPVNNVGIVILTAISSVLFFHEKLSKINKIGIAVSILAIVLIAAS